MVVVLVAGFKCHSAGPDISTFDMESERGGGDGECSHLQKLPSNKLNSVAKLLADIYTQRHQEMPRPLCR